MTVNNVPSGYELFAGLSKAEGSTATPSPYAPAAEPVGSQQGDSVELSPEARQRMAHERAQHAILGRAREAFRAHVTEMSAEEVEAFQERAKAGEYRRADIVHAVANRIAHGVLPGQPDA